MEKGTPNSSYHRKEERIDAALPVMLGDAVGTTRNISANGIFFEIGDCLSAGEEIRFRVELETAEGRVVLQCRGNIVRTEQQNGKTGVAVQIAESVMEVEK